MKKQRRISSDIVTSVENSAQLTSLGQEDLELVAGDLASTIKCALVNDQGQVFTHNSYVVTA